MTGADATFDAFISYSHGDRAWVVERLLPALEGAGIRVAIDFRDFPVGPYAQVNMERAVQASRHVVLVMTPGWLRSEWSQHEYFSIGSAQEKVLPILLTATELPDRLRLRTYADFVNGPFDREMAKVVSAIRSSPPGASEQACAAVEAPPSALPDPGRALAEWKATLADLLVRSGKVRPSSRRALCLEIRVDPDELGFMESSARTFAIELVSWLESTGAAETLLGLCRILEPVFRGEHANRLKAVSASLQGAL